MDLILQTRPNPPYLKLQPTRFPTVAQITLRIQADPPQSQKKLGKHCTATV